MFSTYKRAKEQGFNKDVQFAAMIWLDSDDAFFEQYDKHVNGPTPVMDKLEEVGSAVVGVSKNVVGSAKAGFDVVSWIVTNWQISIVGGVAIILLIKRL